MLEQDPLNDLVCVIRALADDRQSELRAILEALTTQMSQFRQTQLCGTCETCRFYRANTGLEDTGANHYCSRARAALTDLELNKLCMQYRPDTSFSAGPDPLQ